VRASPSGNARPYSALLDGIEIVGNKVPHPAVIFLILCALVIVLSHLFYMLEPA